MNANWNFPIYNFGRRQGISDSGVETFRGNRYMHLAKEICQNSLDAAKDKNKAVKVVFEKFYIDKKEIPGQEEYLQIFDYCYETSQEAGGKVKDFFDYTKTILEEEKISVLRISDYNTTGLTGSDKEKNTPWNDLIKASGTSNKDGEAGGSFGIGKYAAFACSNLRTVFYSTYDIEGISVYQGVAEVINFVDSNGIEREGEGYFGIGKENKPINKIFSLDNNFYRKEDTGTDVYIIGFIEQDDWIESISYSVIDSFLIAIYKGSLEVRVGNTLINKDTLEDIVKNKLNYKQTDRSRSPLEFYRVLTSQETIKSIHTLEEYGGESLGEFELNFLVDNELTSRRILMSRINGMKVFEQDRFPRGIPFAGICILKDKEINNYFRKMETPEHDAWKADQYSENPKEIKKANQTRLDLVRTMRKELNRIASQTTLDETDIEGLGDYLPDIEDDFLGNKGKKESLSNDKGKAKVNINIEDSKNKFEPANYTEGDTEGGRELKGEKNKSKTSYKGDKKFDSKEKSIERIVTDLAKIRIFKKNKKEYRMAVDVVEDISNAKILVSVIGEDSRTREDVDIINAKICKDQSYLAITDKKILIGNISQGERLLIDFEPDIIEQLSMEVVIYAN